MAFSIVPDVFYALYNLCLKFGCFPHWFKRSYIKCVPKPNAADMTSAKSWRPISLLSVPGKILETLLIERVMHNLRSRNLLSNKQFGFTPQRSSEDAILQVVGFMSRTIDSGDVGAIISLDVSGAFDHAWWSAILFRLKELKLPHNLWHLSQNYFSGRTAKLDIGGSLASKIVTRGCPQGSACGPGFWNILYDQVLQLSLPNGCELLSFADDLAMLCRANNIKLLESKVNAAIAMIVDWGRAMRLTFNETKTQAMVFTKTHTVPITTFIMNGTSLPIVESIKYLGVIIDRKLRWNKHLKQVQQKSMKVLGMISSVAHNNWGLSSQVIETIYRGVIEPVVLYAIEAWHPALRFKWANDLLTRIQRHALLMVCKAYRSVSNEALPVIANILPLPDRASMVAKLKIAKRYSIFLSQDSTTTIENNLGNNRHPALSTRLFIKLNRSSQPGTDSTTTIFTDGSKSNDGVGSAFVVYNNSVEVYYEKYRLPCYCSVFQAELLALEKCLIYANSLPTEVKIYSDSFSSLQAIQDRKSTNSMVINIQELLLQRHHQTTISWVKAHVGIAGNERADQLAKDCLGDNVQFVELPAPISYVKRSLQIEALDHWNRRWIIAQNGRWTNKIFPTIEHRKNIGQINLNYITTQFLSGHGKFGTYLHGRHRRVHPNCVCGQEQNCAHLLFDCPLLGDIRAELEDECNNNGLSLSLNNLPDIMAHPLAGKSTLETFCKIHQRLVDWDT